MLVLVLTVVSIVSVAYSTNPAFAQTGPSQYSVNIATKPGLGSYLTNATGFALYTYLHDVPANGTSTCIAICLQKWPAFYVTTLALPPGLNASSFTTITRPDGSKQLAYDGWPLYYYYNDTRPGDTTGQGVLKLWSVATVPTPFSLFATSSITTSDSASTSAAGGW